MVNKPLFHQQYPYFLGRVYPYSQLVMLGEYLFFFRGRNPPKNGWFFKAGRKEYAQYAPSFETSPYEQGEPNPYDIPLNPDCLIGILILAY